MSDATYYVKGMTDDEVLFSPPQSRFFLEKSLCIREIDKVPLMEIREAKEVNGFL